MRGLNQAAAVAAMCLQEEPSVRPLMSDVVTALSFLSMVPATTTSQPLSNITSPPSDDNKIMDHDKAHCKEDSKRERQRAVAEAIEWGSNSRHNHMRSRAGSNASSI